MNRGSKKPAANPLGAATTARVRAGNDLQVATAAAEATVAALARILQRQADGEPVEDEVATARSRTEQASAQMQRRMDAYAAARTAEARALYDANARALRSTTERLSGAQDGAVIAIASLFQTLTDAYASQNAHVERLMIEASALGLVTSIDEDGVSGPDDLQNVGPLPLYVQKDAGQAPHLVANGKALRALSPKEAALSALSTMLIALNDAHFPEPEAA
jgi:hypothetical protein